MGWALWDRVRALFAYGNIYNADSLIQNQTDVSRVVSDGDLINNSQTYSLLDQTNLQINRLERYKDFEQMDEVGEVSLALDLYADEASLVDPERKHSIFIRSKHKRVKEELENLFYNVLLIDDRIRGSVRYLTKFGDYAAQIIPTAKRDGVAKIKHLNIYNFNRIETRNGDLVGFFYQDDSSSNPYFMHPWEVMHIRLTSEENIYHPYGRSMLDGARKSFKQLRLMEDAAIIYRLTRAPERRVFTIPVGNIPPREIPGYIEKIARAFKRKKIFDSASGDVSERWSPHIQEDDYWMPSRPDGTGPTVDTLPGAENLDQIADIEYFKKKMIAPLKIPFSRVGMGDKGEDSKQSLSQVAPEFAKAVVWIQQKISIAYKKIALAHLALKGFTIEEMREFDIGMAATSAIDELYRIEVWNTRADVMTKLKELGFFPTEWIVSSFTNLSEDEISLMEDKKKAVSEEGGGGGGAGGGIGGGIGGDLGGELEGGGEEGAEGLEGEDEISLEQIRRDTAKVFGDQLLQEAETEEEIRAAVLSKILEETAQKELFEKLTIRNMVRSFRERDDNSLIDYLLAENELDGLEGKNGTVLLESSLEEDEVAEAKRTVLTRIFEEMNKEQDSEVDSGEIEPKHLPR